ncbi:Phytanoyl-CoA dioxygenase (PhyH) [Neorhodopirellula lusitana]|uniref:Phytanoyl-CoA dioxygenase (PhyH) n=1 Tax=Neorhodopirellula lusitana TaxID=445327 RepID=A0ABY1PWG7_9BACT|nr:phytanoyl-CoA dioxygenase family protein [Neorhodopirellula lusitana]SMP47759.1 Phytanoyl-CoA dioxygenase (PhyH) [Neorhodopirellula lusitana]
MSKNNKPSSRISPMLQNVARPFLRWYASRPEQFDRYHNKLGPIVNGTYRDYTLECRANYSCPCDEEGVRRQGSILVKNVLETETADRLSSTMSERIDADPNSVQESTSKLMRSVHKPVRSLGKEVIDIFHNPTLDQRIREYFGCYYRIEWLSCYRSLPTQEVSHAWLWHSDNVPCDTLKVMLHLTDAGEQQGATRFMSLDDTSAYYRAGYRGSRKQRLEDLSSFASKNGLPHRPFHHDAKAGDVMLFLNNALHKAVPPQHDHRDVLNYLLIPNPIPWHQQLAIDGIDAIDSNPGGYPDNPRPSSVHRNQAA